MLPGLTEKERLDIVNEAIRLIKRPANFIQGMWKCALFCKPEKPDVLVAFNDSPEGGAVIPEGFVPALDENGERQFSYCVEGAINQAGINILGTTRARELGAWSGMKLWGEPEPAHSSSFAEFLSVNEVARVMIADWENSIEGFHLYAGDVADTPAQSVNDYEQGESEDAKENAHRRVLSILRTRAAQLTS